ncbi:hypothetical protein EDB84DRAFT_1437916 [Lactarius hengduanensis]|nr:hypothetical protein EDB84DRAFT_1437916 [Lactarius hengduanensis]
MTTAWRMISNYLNNEDYEGPKAETSKALETVPPGGVERVQPEAYQKDRARQLEKAFQEWAAEWEKRQGKIRAGRKVASFADKIALTKPPDGNNSPLVPYGWPRRNARRLRRPNFPDAPLPSPQPFKSRWIMPLNHRLLR